MERKIITHPVIRFCCKALEFKMIALLILVDHIFSKNAELCYDDYTFEKTNYLIVYFTAFRFTTRNDCN